MTKPTIRELLDDATQSEADGQALLRTEKDRLAFEALLKRARAGFLLAERVEAVLKEIESLDAGAYETIALSRVLDLLNGEQP